MQRRTINRLVAGAILSAGVVTALSLAMPLAVQAAVQSRLAAIEAHHALELRFDGLRMVSRRILALDQVTVLEPDSGSRLSAESVQLALRPLAVLRGGAAVSSVTATAVEISLPDAVATSGAEGEVSGFMFSAASVNLSDGRVLRIGAPRLVHEAGAGGSRHTMMSSTGLDLRLEPGRDRPAALGVGELAADRIDLDLTDRARWRELSERIRALARQKGIAIPSSAAGRGVAAAAGTEVAPGNARTPVDRMPQLTRLHQATLRLGGGAVGVFDLELEHRDADAMVRLRSSGTLHDRGRPAGSWNIDHALWYERGCMEGSGRVDSLDLGLLGAGLKEYWSAPFEDGILDLVMDADADEAGENVALTGSVRLRDGVVLLPRLFDAAIDLPQIAYGFSAVLDTAAQVEPPRLYRPLPAETVRVSAHDENRGELVFTSGELRIGDVRMSVRPAVRGLNGPSRLPLRLELALDLPPTAIRTIIDTVPREVMGILAGIEVDGTVAWSLDFETPTESISRMQWRSEVTFEDFSLLNLPDRIDVFRLSGPFIHLISDPAIGFERAVRVPRTRTVSTRWLMENAGLLLEEALLLRSRSTSAPVSVLQTSATHRFTPRRDLPPDSDYRYVPLGAVSPWLVRAILTAEDGDFFRHRGVNWNAVRRAVEYNVEVGEYVFGASTITMQLAKNLFLSNDRSLARKLQEFLLVILIEEAAAVPKDRLLEIYLNTIEFGPALFGIHDAAQHYFGKHPYDLDIGEAVWLASIVPAPRQYYRHFEMGEISERWFGRMQQLMHGMLQRGRLSEEQYAAAIEIKPRFFGTGANSAERG